MIPIHNLDEISDEDRQSEILLYDLGKAEVILMKVSDRNTLKKKAILVVNRDQLLDRRAVPALVARRHRGTS